MVSQPAHSAMVFAHGEMIMCNRLRGGKAIAQHIFHAYRHGKHPYTCKRFAVGMSGTGVSGKPSNGVPGHFPLSDGEEPPAKEIMKKIILARRSLASASAKGQTHKHSLIKI